MQRPFPSPKTRRGFTLVELAVVIVIIGVLAAFGVPKFLQSVEKSKATEAFNYWSAVQSAEERYIAQNGVYWDTSVTSPLPTTLDIVLPTLQYFDMTSITASNATAGSPTWAGVSDPQNWELQLWKLHSWLEPGRFCPWHIEHSSSDQSCDR